MYICVTHVDAVTKISCETAPMAHGPAYPDVKGLSIDFANSTEWPTPNPKFYGTCDDDADTSLDGIVKVLTHEEYLQARSSEDSAKANHERHQRNQKLWSQIDAMSPIRWELLTEEQKEQMRVYRQELLDVPQQAGFPWEIVWPKYPLD